MGSKQRWETPMFSWSIIIIPTYLICNFLSQGKDTGTTADIGERLWPSQPTPAWADLPGHGLRPHRYPEWRIQVVPSFIHSIRPLKYAVCLVVIFHIFFLNAASMFTTIVLFCFLLKSGISLKMALRNRLFWMKMTCSGLNCGISTLLRSQSKYATSQDECGYIPSLSTKL